MNEAEIEALMDAVAELVFASTTDAVVSARKVTEEDGAHWELSIAITVAE